MRSKKVTFVEVLHLKFNFSQNFFWATQFLRIPNSHLLNSDEQSLGWVDKGRNHNSSNLVTSKAQFQSENS